MVPEAWTPTQEARRCITMKLRGRTKLAYAIQGVFAQALIAFFRTVFRIMELFGPEKRRKKLRELREKMEAIDRDKKDMFDKIARNPRESVDVFDDFISRHGDLQTQQLHAGTRVRIQAMRQEFDALRAIHAQAGENAGAAVGGFRQYVKDHPASQLAYSYLGAALLVAKDWDASLDAYREAERLAGNDQTSSSMARLNIGTVLHRKGDLEAAVAQYQRIVSTPTESDIAIALAYYYLGIVLNEQGQRSAARAAWKRAARRDRTKVLAKKAREMLKAFP